MLQEIVSNLSKIWAFESTLIFNAGVILYQHPDRTAQSLLCSVQEQEAIFNINKKHEVSCICEMKAADLRKIIIVFTVWQNVASTKHIFDK